MSDLCTLDDVKQYLGMTSVLSADGILSRLVSSASTWLEGQVSQTIALRQYAETLSGDGTFALRLRNSPVVSVQSLTVDGNTISARTSTADGWALQDDWLWLSGPTGAGGSYPWGPLGPYISPTRMTTLRFTVGNGNVSVAYTAGYQTTGEAATVPVQAPFTVTPLHLWTCDVGVSYAGGAALTAVSSSPGSGQYVPGAAYTFSSADAGRAVLLSYGTVPDDIRQAVIELAGETYQRRERLGVMSKTIGGEAVSFQTLSLAQGIRGVIDAYRSPRL